MEKRKIEELFKWEWKNLKMRRICELSSSSSSSNSDEGTLINHFAVQVQSLNVSTKADIANATVGAEPEPDKSIMQLLGGDTLPRDQFGADIHSKISTRWLEMLEKGLDTKKKDDLLKENLPPDNVELLKAPELNYEIKAAATESCHERMIY
ncbi:hypothetical protein EVAR_18126_1 [Eumeta japonica]|uniref:Uncharacterized protein n=1 Tax=Eumeta variegata TaxID=151549 RepID=A0A4C1VH30_EUMVA|nr:hypothetical protein EVAR_18126_1 [Eumeta japonica]